MNTSHHVAVLGCGSVGGFAVWYLASAGVRALTLADREVLEVDNLRRHIGSTRHLGMPKAEVVRDCLADRYPATAIHTERFCFLEDPDRLNAILANADAVLVAVDAEGPKHLIDSLARVRNLPSVYVGVYGGGWGVETIVVDPRRQTPCYACTARAMGRVGIDMAPIASAEYRLPRPDLPIRDWSEANLLSISTAAILGVEAVLSLLNGQGPTDTAWRMNLTPGARTPGEPFCRIAVAVERWPNCPNCGEASFTDLLP